MDKSISLGWFGSGLVVVVVLVSSIVFVRGLAPIDDDCACVLDDESVCLIGVLLSKLLLVVVRRESLPVRRN